MLEKVLDVGVNIKEFRMATIREDTSKSEIHTH